MRFDARHSCPLLCLVIYGLLLLCRSPRFAEAVGQGNYLTRIILQLLIFVIPTIIYCRLKGPGYTATLNFRPVGPAAIGITLLAILTMIGGSLLIRMGQIALLVQGDVSFVGSYPVRLEGTMDAVYAALTFALLPAVCEELVFRSVLFTEYTRGGWGCVTVTGASALLFAMMHFDPAQFPVYLLAGVVLTILTYVTQSVLPAILCHFLYNLYGIFGETALLSLLRRPQNAVFLFFFLLGLFLMLVILFLGECERIFGVYGDCDRPTPTYVTEREKRFPKLSSRLIHATAVPLSPFFILCIVTFVMMTLAVKGA